MPWVLVLGSSSRYRQALLSRVRLPFVVDAPQVDEQPQAGETPMLLAQRLALAKAREVASRWPAAVVIGSDQVAELDGQPLGKPGHHAAAVAQLQAMSGRQVQFYTAGSVLRPATGFEASAMARVQVQMRDMHADDIERYLRLEQPYDCAGSAKCETLGIALIDQIVSDDPTALEGLPLIRTCQLLRQAGLDPLRWAQ
jgi:septum formation protein